MHHIRTPFAALAVLATALTALSCDDDEPAGPSEEQFTATLSGAAERPNPVTTNATGDVQLSFTGSGPITYSVNVSNLTSLPVGGHIHGPAGTDANAGVIVGLMPLASLTTGALVSGTISVTALATVSLDSLKVLLRNGNAYVNIHTANFTDGEIRGQIVRQ